MKAPISQLTAPLFDDTADDSHAMLSLSGLSFRFSNRRRIWRPPTDLFETEGAIVVKVEAAGMSEEDFSITFTRNVLYIAGVRGEPASKVAYLQMEIPYGEFATEVHIRSPIDRERIDAQYRNGFLTVVMPKIKDRRIPVEKG